MANALEVSGNRQSAQGGSRGKIFDPACRPDHLSRAVVGGVLVFALTNSLPLYFISIAAIHAVSSLCELYRPKPGTALSA